MFAGAGENECWEFTAMFDAMGALSTQYNDSPKTASRAFDQTRDGFVIAGGGGIVVLEELEHAKKRGAKIYGAHHRTRERAEPPSDVCVRTTRAPGELVGYGANADGYDMVAPSGEGGMRCMTMAMDMADRIGGEKKVDYVNTHGTSTPVGDVKELGAIKEVFTEKGYACAAISRGSPRPASVLIRARTPPLPQVPAVRRFDQVALRSRPRRGGRARGDLLVADAQQRLPRRERQHQRDCRRVRGHEHPHEAPRRRLDARDVQQLWLRRDELLPRF